MSQANEHPALSRHRLRCEQLFDGDGWHSPGYVEIHDGAVVAAGSLPLPSITQELAGITLPGMPNLHSHAFQRAFAGLTEQRPLAQDPEAGDSFWSWRELMYRFVSHFDPEDVQAITEQAYVEMLECGYTSVAEFHYLHHGPQGVPYTDLAELSKRVIAAARGVGMRMTLLPVYYESAGFGRQPIADNQRRFYNTRERFFDLVTQLEGERDALISLGVAPHSLRAVPLDGLAEVACALPPRRPIHIHIAEQRREVEECLAHYGVRPVELLCREQPVDERWCLVHATHLSTREIGLLAGSGAVVGLCPTTEANLGDGLFPLGEYTRLGGRWGIGSDSQITISVTDELRLLEYGQRLISESRNTVLRGRTATDGSASLHTARVLLSDALSGGARALGNLAGKLQPGSPADLVVLDPDHPTQLARTRDDALNSWVFAANRPAVAKVMVHGDWVVEGGAHRHRHAVQQRFLRVLRRLLGAQ